MRFQTKFLTIIFSIMISAVAFKYLLMTGRLLSLLPMLATKDIAPAIFNLLWDNENAVTVMSWSFAFISSIFISRTSYKLLKKKEVFNDDL